MLYLQLTDQARVNADRLAEVSSRRGVKIHSLGGNRIRLVLHYWIDDEAVGQVIATFQEILGRS
jgi:hypothetical protein